MHMIQLLLPLWSNDGERLPHALFEQVRDELTGRYGGLTAYARTPASGLWRQQGGETVHDDIVVYEVMADGLDVEWWVSYRTELEKRFRQDQLVVRAHKIRVL
ncbi:MAG: hypothetical protein H0X43_03110 [Nitrosospira sp.]|nr:hypothetical protein [Nitrosospira sp.]